MPAFRAIYGKSTILSIILSIHLFCQLPTTVTENQIGKPKIGKKIGGLAKIPKIFPFFFPISHFLSLCVGEAKDSYLFPEIFRPPFTLQQ